MISRTVDRLTSEHPAFEEYCKKRIYIFFDTSEGRNAAAFITAGIAAGIFMGGYNDIIKYAALVISFIVWVQTSVLAGFLKHWLYPVVTAVYFMLPYVFVIRPDTAEAAQATEFQYMLSDLVQAVLLRPMRLIGGDENAQTVSIVMFAACFLLFLVGMRLRSTAKRSDFYCRTRLEQIQ